MSQPAAIVSIVDAETLGRLRSLDDVWARMPAALTLDDFWAALDSGAIRDEQCEVLIFGTRACPVGELVNALVLLAPTPDVRLIILSHDPEVSRAVLSGFHSDDSIREMLAAGQSPLVESLSEADLAKLPQRFIPTVDPHGDVVTVGAPEPEPLADVTTREAAYSELQDLAEGHTGEVGQAAAMLVHQEWGDMTEASRTAAPAPVVPAPGALIAPPQLPDMSIVEGMLGPPTPATQFEAVVPPAQPLPVAPLPPDGAAPVAPVAPVMPLPVATPIASPAPVPAAPGVFSAPPVAPAPMPHDLPAPVLSPQTVMRHPDRAGLTQYVFTFTSSKGGVGKSTTALLTAAMIAAVSQHRVCVIDMDVADGQMMTLVGQSLPTVVHLKEAGRIDDETVRRNLVHHPELNIDVLLAPVNPQAAVSLTPEWYSEVLTVLMRSHSVVILDTGVNYNSALNKHFSYPKCDAVVFVSTLAATSVASMKRGLALMMAPVEKGGLGLPPEKIGVLLNQTFQQSGLSAETLNDARHLRKLVGAVPMATADVVRATNLMAMHELLRHPLMGPAFDQVVRTLMAGDPYLGAPLVPVGPVAVGAAVGSPGKAARGPLRGRKRS